MLIYRNHAYGKPGTAALGLGVNCQQTLAVLKRLGIPAVAAGVVTPADVRVAVESNKPDTCIIEAPWMSIPDTLSLCTDFPKTHFYIRCHSDLAFLQVEPGSVNLLREIQLYSESVPNLGLMGNSVDFCNFMQEAYHGRCTYLPNLYNNERVKTKVIAPITVLKAGSFGAIRLQKNHITGAAAAILLARKFGIGLEFNIVVDGKENGKQEVIQAIRFLFTGLPWAKLIENSWQPWPLFRRLASTLDIAFHLSCTETFSLSTADCLAEGVPVVGSCVIDWLPSDWLVNLDNATEAADVGYKILRHHHLNAQRAQTIIGDVCERNESVWLDLFMG